MPVSDAVGTFQAVEKVVVGLVDDTKTDSNTTKTSLKQPQKGVLDL